MDNKSKDIVSYLQDNLKNFSYYDDLNENQEYLDINEQLRILRLRLIEIEETNENNKKLAGFLKDQISQQTIKEAP